MWLIDNFIHLHIIPNIAIKIGKHITKKAKAKTKM